MGPLAFFEQFLSTFASQKIINMSPMAPTRPLVLSLPCPRYASALIHPSQPTAHSGPNYQTGYYAFLIMFVYMRALGGWFCSSLVGLLESCKAQN